MNYQHYFEQALQTIRQEDRYRVFNALERDAQFPKSQAHVKHVELEHALAALYEHCPHAYES